MSEWSVESVGVVEVVEVVGVAGAFYRSGWIGRGGRVDNPIPAPDKSISSAN